MVGSRGCLFVVYLNVIKRVNLFLAPVLPGGSDAVCNGQIFQAVSAL